jgi:excinuclease ABC subunit C
MQKELKLNNYPETIACVDISHIAGTFTVGSLVCFKKGKPYKKNYRRFKIRETKGIDDYKSIEEVLTRYFEKLKSQNKPFPDLVVIDGGKGQLHAAEKVFEKLQLPCDLISLAKKEETVFTKSLLQGYILDTSHLFSRILIKIRDEAHRFAINYNKTLRKKANTSSQLTDIKGIGKIKAEKLLKKFKSYENVLNATPKQLKEILNNNDIKNLKIRQNGTFLTKK